MAYYVYILTNRPGGALYIGMTNDIARRVYEHRLGRGSAFARKYNLHKLVYMECHDEPLAAIRREKAMKEWRRAWKIALIEDTNPNWDDLYERINM